MATSTNGRLLLTLFVGTFVGSGWAQGQAPGVPGPADVLARSEGAEQVAAINAALRKVWGQEKLKPAERCSDYEFIRRATLDVLGRIATIPEIERFLKEPPHLRRSRLIDRLLGLEKGDGQPRYNQEYAAHWADVWTVLLIGRAGGLNPSTALYHEQLRLWLEEQFARPDLTLDKLTMALLTATGKTNENGAVNFILAHLGQELPRKAWSVEGRFDVAPLTGRTMRVFLGIRGHCLQCHDSAYHESLRQNTFWELNACFRQLDAPQGRPRPGRGKGASGQFLLVDNPELNQDGLVLRETRNLRRLGPRFLDGQRVSAKADRRKELAKLVIESKYFAAAQVNRLWAHFFGQALAPGVDDFSDQNSLLDPKLLDRLAKDFATRARHNPRELIRWICNSAAYGLSSVANKTNACPDAEVLFSRALLRPLTAEQLFESLRVATGQSDAMVKEKQRRRWLADFLFEYGDDEDNEASLTGTLRQVLLLMNGRDLHDAITAEKGTLATLLKRCPPTLSGCRQVCQGLFLATLNRPPTDTEQQRLLAPFLPGLKRLPEETRARFFASYAEDVFWALLNSGEFCLNH